MEETLFEKSQSKQRAYSLPKSSPLFDSFHPPEGLLRKTAIALPEVSELDLMRHFSRLAQLNMSIDTQFYPLGSCTMKYNPRVNEYVAALTGFLRTHPLAPEEMVQGNLQLIEELVSLLCQIVGMDAGTLLPSAGAQGELIGLLLIKAYHKSRGEEYRDEMLIPDSAHGTNPASATMVGFRILSIRTHPSGDLDLDQLRDLVSSRTAGLMLTNPNTLGLFSSSILEIQEIIHEAGGLLYCDGANLNAILNLARPGDMGFDVMHVNLHKTFSTPHGGGGPGSGPVLCKEKLKPFLPIPRVEKNKEGYELVWKDFKSIGYSASFHGHFSVYLRAYLYIKLHGHFGLRRIAEMAVLNANYLKCKMAPFFKIPYPQFCMHEFVIQCDTYLDKGIRALDIAKRLLDYGIHAPTIYFPLIVRECLLIEPTETESKATLDHFIEVLYKIITEVEQEASLVKEAPHTLAVNRLDEVRAAKLPILRH